MNPANNMPIAKLGYASRADLDAAVNAASAGFKVWRKVSAFERGKILRKAADLVRERSEHISKVMTQEQGKPYPESRGEVLTSADIIDWYAEEGRRSYGRIVPGRVKGVRQIVTQEPVGVVAAFTPWNFPTLTPVRKIAGALAAGCSIIVKAPEETPASPAVLLRTFVYPGVPDGVIHLVFGAPAEIPDDLIPHPLIRAKSSMRSTPVRTQLAARA